MQFKYSLGVISLCSALFLVGCNDDNSSVSQTPTVQEQKQKLQPIIIQGALPVESERMASKLENKTVEKNRWLDLLERNLQWLSNDYF